MAFGAPEWHPHFLGNDMAKLIKPFRGVPNGEIYPKQYEAGDECPQELEAGAAELGALEDSEEKKAPAAKK